MKAARYLATGAALLLFAVPVSAQVSSESQDFFKALRGRDNTKALQIIKDRPLLLNARDEKGETALVIVIARRDPDWIGYLLDIGADPDVAAKNGDTPLIAAARIGYIEAAQELIRRKAKVDAANRMGETPLIVAVQQRQVALIKLLLQFGANPDKADSAAGYSARDYAKRDNRGREILKLIEAKKPTPLSAAKP